MGTATTVMFAAALLAGCAGDDDSGGSGGGNVFLQGTACTTPVQYTLTGDEKLYVWFDTTDPTLLKGIGVLDGPFFDTEDQTAWNTYAASYDTVLLLAFDDPEPATPHTVTAIFDSFFGGRGVGAIGFVEHGNGESVEIRAIDTAAKTIDVQFTIPVGAFVSSYPPDFAALDRCNAGSVTGSFSGTYEIPSV